jgi:hypothetical protein
MFFDYFLWAIAGKVTRRAGERTRTRPATRRSIVNQECSGDPLVLPDDGKTPTDWRRVWRELGAITLAYLLMRLGIGEEDDRRH